LLVSIFNHLSNQDVNPVSAKIEARVAKKKADIDTTVQEWKKNREITKLETRADTAQVYAAFAVEFATAAGVETDIAAMEAVVARINAEQAIVS
jgi:hypothetical protein